MWSIGTRIGIWVLGIPGSGILLLLITLYSIGGLNFATPVIPWAISGTGALVFLWQGLKTSSGKKLDYLNENAFSPLRNLVAIDNPGRARNSLDPNQIGTISEVLKGSGRYLIFRFYPKKLLGETTILSKDALEHKSLWDLLYSESWKIAGRDKELAAQYANDFGAVLYRSGLDNRYNDAYFSAEKKAGADMLISIFQKENPGKLERLKTLTQTLLSEATSIGKLLDEFMRANLLGLLPPASL